MVMINWFVDVNSYLINLGGRRDRAFYLYRDLCQYLMTKLLDLSVTDAKALTVTEFLARIKLGTDFDHACRVRADKEKHEKKHEGVPIEKVVTQVREEFSCLARSYIVFLFRETQGLKSLTTKVVRGLVSYDLKTQLLDPLDRATYCFRQLFSSFRLRGCYTITEESQCLEE